MKPLEGVIMSCSISLPAFDGPLDLLLHLIKQSNINICDIEIVEITRQYLEYIHKMEEMNLDIASEYLVMAAELIEIKSKVLLPTQEEENEEEDPKEKLIQRLLEYEQYKESTTTLRKLEIVRQEVKTKEPSDLLEFKDNNTVINYGITLDNLLDAFSKFLVNSENIRPLNTRITNKEYSVGKRCTEIRDIIHQKKKVKFQDLFDVFTKEYIVVTFLAILSLSKKQEIKIEQSKNFDNIIIEAR